MGTTRQKRNWGTDRALRHGQDPPPATPDHATIHTLAARAQIDPRTARRVLTEGLGVIRVGTIRERVAAALAEVGRSTLARAGT
jgi:hypothetical protein